MNLLVLQILSVALTLLALKGDKSEESPIVIFLSLIPGIGYLIGVLAFAYIIFRMVQSKGKCFLGHTYTETYDSEKAKWKNGNYPMRISVGGYTEYKCDRCCQKVSHSWRAF